MARTDDRGTTPRTIALDFDGVLHSYTRGWTGERPDDPPVPGAREAVAALQAAGFEVVVFTCRALTHGGQLGTFDWLLEHGFGPLAVTAVKPHAELYVDDRAQRFNGSWSELLHMAERGHTPRPWYHPQPAGGVA